MSDQTLDEAMMDRAMHIPGTSDRIENIPSEWLSASTCTGCGTFEIALRSVANAVSEHRPVNSDAIAVTCHQISICIMYYVIVCINLYFFSVETAL